MIEKKYKNVLILGDCNSGKNKIRKKEIEYILENTADHIYVLDLYGEYADMVKKYQGQLIKIDPDYTNAKEYFINPFDRCDNCNNSCIPMFLETILERTLSDKENDIILKILENIYELKKTSKLN